MNDDAPMGQDAALSTVPLVGIGASAGGLEALKIFLSGMASQAGLACVVVQHLDPDHESMMAELLARHTGMRVLQAEDGMRVEADHVYLIPPRKYIALQDDHLRLQDPTKRRGHRMPIDHFFRSLAEARGDASMCVVLSGTGSDGTLGLKAVKEVGGLTVAQEPDEAQHDGMPRSAIATDLVDLVLPVREMPRALLRYVRHPFYPGRKPAPSEEDDGGDEIERILRLLKERRRHDFSSYKRGTLVRRVERRAGLLHLPDLATYRDRLEHDEKELDALQKDLLIGVTRFFRDPDAWQVLQSHVLPALCERADEETPVRVWVPGAATGEEAYSIAMLAYEHLAHVGKSNCRVQIFATDIDTEALEAARAGLYPESIEGDVPAERLQRFFHREGDRYRVRKFLRESVTFAAQNVITDPPFSKVDLASCRNLLIYLGADVQRRVLELLHFALNPGGYLFLGTAEGVGPATSLFRPVDKKWRIYQRLPARHAPHLEFGRQPRGVGRSFGPRPEKRPPSLREVAERAVLETFGPSAVLLNRSYDVLQFVGRTGRWLEPPSGDPTVDLLSLASSAIRPKVRSVLHQVVRDGAHEAAAEARMDGNGREGVRIHARHVESEASEEDLFLLAFEPLELPPVSPPEERAGLEGRPEAEQMIRDLEGELRNTRDDLHSTIEQLEAANEELKASNEEVMSMNEELQSTNEELETSKEELQSLNEELVTVNSQLQEKVVELEGTTNDLHNLLASTEIATLFLDRSLRIKRYTPTIRRLSRLLPSDVGRSVSDLSGVLGREGLAEDCRSVLERLRPVEREIESEDGGCFLQRVLPYRTEADRIDGVVVTFVDLGERREKERAQAELAAIVDSAADAILSQTPEGRVVRWGRGAERMYGYSAAEAEGRPIQELIVPEDRRQELAEALARVQEGRVVENLETVRRCRDGELRHVVLSLAPIRDGEGRIVAVASVARDVTEDRRRQRALRRSEARFEAALKGSQVTVFEQDRDLVYRWISNPLVRLAPEEIAGRTDRELFPSAADALEALKREVLQSGETRRRTLELELDGQRRWFDMHVEAQRDDTGAVSGILAAASEVSEAKRAEAALRQADRRKDQLLAVLGHELRNPLGAVGAAAEGLALDHEGDVRLERIRTGVRQMGRLLDDLLNTARISEGYIELRRQAVDVGAVVDRAAATTAHRFERAGARLEREIPAALPPIDGDPDRVHQILVNLLVNALEHAGEGPAVTVRAEGGDGVVRLCVEDDGPGLPLGVLEEVFGSERAPEPAATAGMGIGLTVVRSLAELHGGRAWGDGGAPGARLCVELPTRRSGREHGHEPPPASDAPAQAAPVRRVLLVDDNEDMVTSMALLLRRHGFEVESATSAEAALSVAERWRPDLALIDIGLPDMSGYELSGMLRRLPGLSELRMVAVSGWGQAEHVERSREAGFERHLVKPVDVATLRGLVGEESEG